MNTETSGMIFNLAYSHLIAIDRKTGDLVAGVRVNPEEWWLDVSKLRQAVADAIEPGISKTGAASSFESLFYFTEIWQRCDVFSVLVSDDEYFAPEGAPASARLVYSGNEKGWLPEYEYAAWGEKVSEP